MGSDAVASDGFTWAPDGSRLVYLASSGSPDFASNLVTVRPDGSGRRVVVRDAGGEGFNVPVWSPDSTRLAFAGGDLTPGPDEFDSEILVVNRDGTGLRQVTDDALDDFDPAWAS